MKTRPARPVLEEFEPRILYSADFAPAALAGFSLPGASEQRLLQAQETPAASPAAIEIAFVDVSLPDAQRLIDDLQTQRDAGRPITIVRIEAGKDGISRIGEALDGRNDVSAVHVLSHGDAGVLQLGSVRLDAATLLARAGELAQWSAALSADADLLLYGCDVAATGTGQHLLAGLAALTGADVAASDDLTGAAARGGNWALEFASGSIHTASALSLSAQQSWSGLLLASTNETLVNQTTSNTQATSAENRGSQQAVALDAAGNHVVVWTSENGQDGSGQGVYARRFDSNGTATTAEIAVNAWTTDDQRSARVVCDAAGNFVVTWTSENQDGSVDGVYMRRFDANGVALTAETRVNATTTGAQTDSAIAMNASNGDYVIAWQGEGPGDTAGIFFRRFNADGTAKDATDRLANLTNAGTENDPAVTMAPDGKFVIVWEAGSNIYLQRFDAAGAVLGSAVQVDSGVSPASGASVASDAAGNFTIAYRTQNAFAPLAGVWVKGFNADGSFKYSWSQVDSGDATNPSIDMAADGSFVVVYHKTGSGTDVYARKYNADGTAAGTAFRINQTTSADQSSASVAVVDTNNYVVVWSGNGPGDANGVFARQFGPSVQITAAQDTYINSGSSSNFGTSSSLVVDRSGGNLGNGRALLQFDLSAIPAGATITGATLELQATANASPFMIDVYRLTEAWVEGNGGTSAANWTNRLTGTAWTNINGASVDPTPAATWATLPPAGAGLHSWDLTNLVRAWKTGSSVNHGILLGSANTGTTTVTYGSSESTTPPRLVVTYTLNAAPVITSNGGGASAAINVAENATAVGTVTATDADLPAQTLTYSISGGADAARFTIDANTGVLGFVAPPNREAPTDTGANNVYDVTVQVSDGTVSDSQAIAVTVSDVNEFPVGAITDANAAVNSVPENMGVGTLVGVTGIAVDADATSNAITYTLDDSAGGRFAIDSSTGVLSVAGLLDYETFTNHTVTVRAASADGSFSTALFTIGVTDASETAVGAISDANVAANQVAENSGAGTLVGITASASDVDVLDVVSYTLIDNAGGRFAIDTTTGVVVVAGALDAETATSHTIVVRANSTDGSFNTQVFTIAVVDVDEFAIGAVSDTAASANAVDENAVNGTLVGITALAVDADATNNTALYSLDDSAGGRFAIHASTGVVTVAGAIDREVAPSQTIVVRATSADGSFSTQNFAIAVNPLNDNAPDITSDGGAGTASISVAENGTTVTTVVATDADLPAQSLSYSIIGGADQALFSIDAITGVLSFISAPDFENPSDAGTSNNYYVDVQASDGGLAITQSIRVTVTPVNDASPVIASDGGGASASINVAENSTAVTTVVATDADLPAPTPTYSIVGGADQALFSIDASTGVLSFASAPDREAPSDAGADNVYNVTVQANDGSLSATQTIAVTVTAVNDNVPVISLPAPQVTAMDGVLVMSTARGNAITLSDADAGTGTVEVVLGATQGSLTLSRTGGLTFATGDGSLDAFMRFTGTLADINDALDGLRFTPSTGYLGTAALSVGIDDLGNSGSGGPLSASATLAVEVADDQRVNTVTSGNQTEPATAMDAAGNYVVTWTSDGQDGGGKGIYAQRYDAAGNVVGAAFRVNTTTAGDQTASSVAMAEGGEFVVVWTSDDAAGKGVFAQRYNNLGVAQGGQFQVNSVTTDDQIAPSVAMAADGSFVVAWASDSGSSRFDVYARRYDAGGVAAGIEVRVNTAVDKNQFQPAVAMHPSGAFVVAWTSTSPSDGSGTGVYAQRFAANGTTTGGEFRVNSTTAGNQDRPALAIGPDGGFVVAWTSGDGLDGDKSGVFGQRYAADGSALGAEFQVNSFVNDSQSLPTVAFDDAGAFTVAWSSKNQDGNGWGVFAQQFDSSGVRVGLEYRVSATTGGDQTAAAVAAGQSGQLVVVWQGNGPDDGSGIFQRLIVAPNDAPVITVPVAQTSPEDAPLVLSSANGNRISITDADAFGQPVQVSLSVTQGTLSLTSTSGLTFGAGTGSGDASMSFTGTLADINTALDGLRFDPLADFAGAAALSIAVDDLGHSGSGGALLANATVAITVAAMNDAPTLAQALADQAANEDVAFAFTVPAGSFADIDSGDVLTYSATLASGAALPTWLSFNAATRTFSGTPGNADVGAIDVRVTATDTSNVSVFDDFRLTVANVNDAPVLAVALSDQGATEGVAFRFTVPAGSFADVDAGDALAYSATLASGAALPAWLSFDAATRTFTGTPANADVGAIDVRVTATDPSNANIFDDFRLTVGNVNDAPTVAAPIADQSAAQNAAFSFTVPGGSFADIDTADALTYTATLVSGAALPAWLSFDAATQSFSGTPANADVGAISVRVTATDGSNASVFDDFTLTVANVNDAPVITSNGGTSSASISVAENNTTVTTVTATDVDQPAQTLSYSISGGADASRFTIDGASGVLTFTSAPDFDAPGDANGDNVYDVIVQVRDGGLTDTQAIAVTVTALNDNAPVITSDGGGATAVLGRAENATAVTTVAATDADALDVLRFAITGGADAARFSIDPVSGALSFVAAPDHEAPADANGDNRYEVTVTVSDGALIAQQALFIDVGNVDEAPTIVTNVLLLSKDGATIVLLGTDPDTAATALNYQASGQVGGRFELVAAPGVAVTGFSQAQVDAGAVRFVADGSGAGPTYVLSLSDGVSTVTSGAPQVVIQAAAPDAAPPVVPVAQTPDAPPAATTKAAAPAAAPAAAAPPAVVPAAPGPLSQALLTEPRNDSFDPGRAPSNSVAVAAPAASTATRDSTVTAVATLAQFALLSETSENAGTSGAPTIDLASALRDRLLGEQLDEQRDSAESSQRSVKDVQAASAVMTTGLSVGYVLWLARGGVLVASLMSALPAWAMVDPLPVLAQMKRRDGDTDDGGADDDADDPLEKLFSKARQVVARGSSTPTAATATQTPPAPGHVAVDNDSLEQPA